jgi:hypothetical protein
MDLAEVIDYTHPMLGRHLNPDFKIDKNAPDISTEYLYKKMYEVAKGADNIDIVYRKDEETGYSVMAFRFKGKNAKYKIYLDAQHGYEHSGPEIILRMLKHGKINDFYLKLLTTLKFLQSLWSQKHFQINMGMQIRI